MRIVCSQFSLFTVTCLALIASIGCGENRLPPGETGTVSGKLTYNGKPVAKGTTILFMEDKSGLLAVGTADERGDYLLEMKGGLKVVCGTYRVSVAAASVGAGLNVEQAMNASIKTKPNTAGDANNQIPERYRSPEMSKTVFEVKPGPNVFDLDMKD